MGTPAYGCLPLHSTTYEMQTLRWYEEVTVNQSQYRQQTGNLTIWRVTGLGLTKEGTIGSGDDAPNLPICEPEVLNHPRQPHWLRCRAENATVWKSDNLTWMDWSSHRPHDTSLGGTPKDMVEGQWGGPPWTYAWTIVVVGSSHGDQCDWGDF